MVFQRARDFFQNSESEDEAAAQKEAKEMIKEVENQGMLKTV